MPDGDMRSAYKPGHIGFTRPRSGITDETPGLTLDIYEHVGVLTPVANNSVSDMNLGSAVRTAVLNYRCGIVALDATQLSAQGKTDYGVRFPSLYAPEGARLVVLGLTPEDIEEVRKSPRLKAFLEADKTRRPSVREIGELLVV